MVRSHRLKGLVIALVAALSDQVSKQHMLHFFKKHHIELGGHKQTINLYFDYVLAWNKGVSFSMLNQYGTTGRYVLIAFASVICIALARWLMKSNNIILSIGLGLILGGAIGNIIDRIRYGAVIDFLHFHYQHWSWPAFNFADTFICMGVPFMILESYYQKKGNNNDV